jgi:hypothetical protein
MTVHNHGSEEGEGLACPELRLPSGELKGRCLMNSLQNDPLDCQEKAKQMVVDHISKRYENRAVYDVYIESYIAIGKTWRAVLRTTLPNSGVYVVEYYALEKKMTLRVYAMVEELSSYKG